MMVDYGFMASITRQDIWSPIRGMNLFTLPPFGISCRMEEELTKHSDMSSVVWKNFLLEKSMRVQVGSRSPDGRFYTVSLIDCFMNKAIRNNLKDVLRHGI